MLPGGAAPSDRPGGSATRAPQRQRIIEAALSTVTRLGMSKTTLDDVAREAGVSRATVYRVFPGGKDAVVAAVTETETARLFSRLGACMGTASTLTDALVAGMVEASTFLREHRALRVLLKHEPEIVLSHLTFDEADRMFGTASAFVAPFLARWMDVDEALRVAEWAARIVLTYAMDPSSLLDVTDPADTGTIVAMFMLPGIRALRAADPGDPVHLEGPSRDRAGADAVLTRSDAWTTDDRSKGEVS